MWVIMCVNVYNNICTGLVVSRYAILIHVHAVLCYIAGRQDHGAWFGVAVCFYASTAF